MLGTRQVVEFLGLSPETVLRCYRDGSLPGYRLASKRAAIPESPRDVERNRRVDRCEAQSDALPARGATTFELARNTGTSVGMIETHYGALIDTAHDAILSRLEAIA